MKSRKLLALLFALVLIFGTMSAASANAKVLNLKGNPFIGGESVYTLSNGEYAKFFTQYYPSNIFDKEGNYYSELAFDVEGIVSGKVTSGSSWLKVTNYKYKPCTVTILENERLKPRKGTIKFTGKNFSATIEITQYGKAQITSAVRKGKKINLTLKKASGTINHFLSIDEYSLSGDDQVDYSNYHYRTVYNDIFNGKTFSFIVKPGYYYSIYYGTALNTTYGHYAYFGSYAYFTVTTTKGSQQPDYIY